MTAVGRSGELRQLARWSDFALAELQGIDEDYLLSENPDLLVEALVAKHLPDPVILRWDQAHQGKVRETQLEGYDPFDRTPIRSTGRPHQRRHGRRSGTKIFAYARSR